MQKLLLYVVIGFIFGSIFMLASAIDSINETMKLVIERGDMQRDQIKKLETRLRALEEK